MSHRHTYAAVNYVPECEQATAEKVFEILERWRQRSEEHFANRRRDLRFPYPNRALVVVPVVPADADGAAPAHVVVKVQTRNLSCGGVSLLAAPVYVPQKGDGAPLLTAERLFATGREVSIGLPQPGEEILWMRGTVVRSRVVHFGFRECGVSFVSRQCSDAELG